MKKQIIEGVEARIAAQAARKAAQAPEEVPAAPEEEQKQDALVAPFNAFGSVGQKGPQVEPASSAGIKEEPLSESEEEKELVVNDLRKCHKCGGKSYIRQGLCVNIYCELYYMGRANAGQRLQAKGLLSEGAQWNPKDWHRSGNYSKVEDELLRQEWKGQLHQLKSLPIQPAVDFPKPASEIFGKEPIVIEDLETGEVEAHGEGFVDKSPMEAAPVEKAAMDRSAVEKEAAMAQALRQSSYKVRNKGLKRLRSLANRIEEKKRKGEWHGEDVPVPGFARGFLQDVMAPLAQQRTNDGI